MKAIVRPLALGLALLLVGSVFAWSQAKPAGPRIEGQTKYAAHQLITL